MSLKYTLAANWRRKLSLEALENRFALATATQFVADIYPGATSSSPQVFPALNGIGYFAASNGVNAGLWKTDGTTAGTAFVKGSFGEVRDAANVNGTLFLTTMAGELWKSDGTTAGTVLLKSGLSDPRLMSAAGGSVFFQSRGEALWKTDGTPTGTVIVKSFPRQAGTPATVQLLSASLGGNLYFAANDGIHGHELWRSDGTSEGTTLVADVIPGASGGLGATWLFARVGALISAMNAVRGWDGKGSVLALSGVNWFRG